MYATLRVNHFSSPKGSCKGLFKWSTFTFIQINTPALPSPHYFTLHPHPPPPPEGWRECLKIWYSPRKMTKSRTLQWGIIWQLSAAHRGQWLVNAQCYTWLTGGEGRLWGQEVMSRLCFSVSVEAEWERGGEMAPIHQVCHVTWAQNISAPTIGCKLVGICCFIFLLFIFLHCSCSFFQLFFCGINKGLLLESLCFCFVVIIFCYYFY